MTKRQQARKERAQDRGGKGRSLSAQNKWIKVGPHDGKRAVYKYNPYYEQYVFIPALPTTGRSA